MSLAEVDIIKRYYHDMNTRTHLSDFYGDTIISCEHNEHLNVYTSSEYLTLTCFHFSI